MTKLTSHPSPHVRHVAAEVMRYLRRVGPSSLQEMTSVLGVGDSSFHRARRWLRSAGIPLHFVRSDMLWHLGVTEDPANWTLAQAAAAGAIDTAEAAVLAALTASLTRRDKTG